MRTIEISENQAKLLEELAERDNIAPAAAVTSARSAYFLRKKLDPLRSGFGLWADRPEIDGVDYQRGLRDE